MKRRKRKIDDNFYLADDFARSHRHEVVHVEATVSRDVPTVQVWVELTVEEAERVYPELLDLFA